MLTRITTHFVLLTPLANLRLYYRQHPQLRTRYFMGLLLQLHGGLPILGMILIRQTVSRIHMKKSCSMQHALISRGLFRN